MRKDSFRNALEFSAWLFDSNQEGAKNLDLPKLVDAWARAGIDHIYFFAKEGYTGVCYYDTKSGLRNQAGRDYLREVVDEAEKRDIKVFADLIVASDAIAARKPEWSCLDEEGHPIIIRYENLMWHIPCLNSPFKDYIINLANELADNYRIAGYYLDCVFIPENGCTCRSCEEKFRRVQGYELPRGDRGHRDLRSELAEFRLQSIMDFLDEFRRQVITQHPNLTYTYNLSEPAAPPTIAEICYLSLWQKGLLESDFNRVEAHSYLDAVVRSKMLRSLGIPFEIVTPRDYNWLEWRPRPTYELATYRAITHINGGSFAIEDRNYPDGSVREGEFRYLGEVFGDQKIREFTEGDETLPEVAILYTHESNRIKYFRGEDAFLPLKGISKVLVDQNIQFDLLNERNLDALSKYEAVLIPDQPCLSSSTAEQVRKYVADGGNLVASFRTSLFDEEGKPGAFRLGEVFGVEFTEFSPYTVNYVKIAAPEIAGGVPTMPLPVRGAAARVRAASARTLAELVYPIGGLTDLTGILTPPGGSSGSPSITLNRYGEGRGIYVAHPIEMTYIVEQFWALAQIMENLLSLIHPQRIVRVNSPHRIKVFVTMQREKGRVLIHLLNEADWSNMGHIKGFMAYTQQSSTYSKSPSVQEVRISIHTPAIAEVPRVYDAATEEELDYQRDEMSITLKVPFVDTHTILVLQPVNVNRLLSPLSTADV